MNLKYKNQNGFSLIAVALILAVLGAAVILALMPQSAIRFGQTVKTQDKLDKIRATITTYAAQNGGVNPCPARLNAAMTTAVAPLFGISVNACAAATDCIDTGANAGGIFCPGAAKTWVGAVPVRTLGLPDEYAFDEWGNRITYIVNNSATFIITDATGTTTSPPATLTYFHALSHGPNGIGSYLRSGAANSTTCTQGALSATLSEFQNCDFATNNTFLSRAKDTTAGSITYYDDVSFRY